MLDAADRSKASLNFAVRIHNNTPDELLMTVADLHYNGVSSVSLMNDEICLQALKNRGFTENERCTADGLPGMWKGGIAEEDLSGWIPAQGWRLV
jgi:pyruvate-formate lyase